MNNKVLTSGYVSMDHIMKIDPPAAVGKTSLITNATHSEIFYGGCSVNIAYALCRLGIKAAPIMRVGTDYESIGFKRFLEEGDVPFDGLEVIPGELTSRCYLLQDSQNEHITIFYPGAMAENHARPLSDALFQNIRLCIMTVASKRDNVEFFRQCRKFQIPLAFGMKSDDSAFPPDFLREILTESTIIFTNRTECHAIEVLLSLDDISGLFSRSRVEIIVTTLGEEGSRCFIRTKERIRTIHVPAKPVSKIVDATGAGDAFMAGFLFGYLKGLTPEENCQLGSTMAYFVLQKEGCCTNLPSLEQLMHEGFSNRNPSDLSEETEII